MQLKTREWQVFENESSQEMVYLGNNILENDTS
jgi:hypothetical protein